MDVNFQQKFLIKISEIFEPVLLVDDETSLNALLKSVGWDVNLIDGFSSSDLLTKINAFKTAYTALNSLITNPPNSLLDFIAALETVKTIFDSIKDLTNITSAGYNYNTTIFKTVGKDIVITSIVYKISNDAPFLFSVLKLLNIIIADEDTLSTILIDSNNKIIKPPYFKLDINFSALSNVVLNPYKYLKDLYFDDITKDLIIENGKVKLFNILESILGGYGLDVTNGVREEDKSLFDLNTYDKVSKMLTAYKKIDNKSLEYGFSISYSSPSKGNLGLIFIPYGNLNFSSIFNDFDLESSISASSGFAINSNGITALSGESQNVEAKISLTKTSPTGITKVGSTTGTRLELGDLAIAAIINNNGYGIEFNTGSSTFIISTENSLLNYILPKDGLKINFDLGIGWSNKKGIYFKGSAGLETILPIHKSFFNAIELESIKLSLGASGSGINTTAGISLNVKLGILNASIQDVGLKANVIFPSTGGNLGFANLNLGFKNPTGISASLENDIISGGGYLNIDSDKGQYSGILNLNIKKKFSVTAIGILVTKLPDGNSGYSFLGLINVTFSPGIQLGYGFVLEGLGGIVGINRSINASAIQAGVRNNTISSALIPPNPVENAVQIINDLNGFFPIQTGRYVFGVLGRLSWGTPALITADIGLVIEIPDPLKIAILGKAKCILPTESSAIVALEVNFAGILDFGRNSLSFDASLVNSRILCFTIEGDMILRVKGGSNPNFVLSVGGFHPAYRPPSNLSIPSGLKRLRVTISSSSNCRIGVEGYMAVTSNSLQFGARAFLYASVGNFSVDGQLGFDALFQINPFYISVSMYVSLSLSYKGDEICGVGANVTLTGPTPWHAYGSVRFKIWIFKYTKSFDKTIGGTAAPVALPDVKIVPMLLTSLKEKNNWTATLPVSKNHGVSLYEVKAVAGEIIVNPGSVISVVQKIVPLKFAIEKYGEGKPSDGTKFEVSSATFGANSAGNLADVKDFFSPGQFKRLDNNQKLSAPSFEKYNNGVQFGVSGTVQAGSGIVKEVKYERIVIDKPDNVRVRFKYLNKANELSLSYGLQIGGGSAALSSFSAINKAPLNNAIPISLEQFAVAHADTGGMYSTSLYGTKNEADEAIKNLIALNPNLENQLYTVSEFEIQ